MTRALTDNAVMAPLTTIMATASPINKRSDGDIRVRLVLEARRNNSVAIGAPILRLVAFVLDKGC
jgi:hypothetical protein